MKAARDKFKSDRQAIERINHSALAQTHRQAIQKAISDFKAAMEKARADLKAAFPKVTPTPAPF